jgi:HlyD family secretion protein
MTKSKNRSYLKIGLAVLVLLIVLAIYRSKTRPKGEQVYTELVSERNIKELVSASGKIYPQTEVKISSDVSGELVALYVKEGDTVKSGQVLAKIDPDLYQSQLERTEAAVSQSKSQLNNAQSAINNAKAQRSQVAAQLENAKRVFKRNEQLHKDGVISDLDFDNSKTSFKALEANLEAADAAVAQAVETSNSAKFGIKSSKASLSEVQKTLRRTLVIAPTSGVVSQLNVKKGERVLGTIQMAGTEIMRIANLNIMEVQAEVSENDILKVALGNQAMIIVDAYPDRKFLGKVTEIANSAIGSSLPSAGLSTDKITNYIVKIVIDPSSYEDLAKGGKIPFRPGMSASVDLITREIDKAVCVPIQSVTTREKKQEKSIDDKKDKEVKLDDIRTLILVASSDTVKYIDVKVGIQDDNFIQITDGLKGIKEVIAGPYSSISRTLEEGKRIQVVTKEELNNAKSSGKGKENEN